MLHRAKYFAPCVTVVNWKQAKIDLILLEAVQMKTAMRDYISPLCYQSKHAKQMRCQAKEENV